MLASLKLLVDAAAVLLLVMVPGIGLVRWIFPRQPFSTARLLAYASIPGFGVHCLLGSLYFTGLGESLNWVLPVLLLPSMVLGLLVLRESGVKADRWSVVLIVFSAISVALTAVGLIPGIIEVGYGDLPSYSRIIHNLRAGHFPLIDFRVGDYVGEQYRIPLQYPFHVLVGASLETFVGDFRLLEIINILCGVLALYLGASWIGTKANVRTPALAFVVLLALCLFDNGLQFALGAITLPVLLFAVVCWDLLFFSELPRGRSRVVFLAGSLLLLGVSRPEGALMAGLLALGMGASGAYRFIDRRTFSKKWPALLVIATVMIGVGMAGLSLMGPTASFHYLHFSERIGRFQIGLDEAGNDPATLNYDHAREGFGESRRYTPINTSAHRDLVLHPVALGHWLGATWMMQLGWEYLSIFIALLIFAGVSATAQALAAAALGLSVLVLLPLMNLSFTVRHMLPVNGVLLLAVLQGWTPILAKHGAKKIRQWERVGYAVSLGLLVLVAAQVNAAYHLRKRSHVLFVPIFERLRERLGPSSVIATTYPQLFAHVLDVKSVGNSFLLSFLPEIAEKYAPDFFIIDNARVDLRPYYSISRADHALLNALLDRGYYRLHDSPEQGFCIFAKKQKRTAALNGSIMVPP